MNSRSLKTVSYNYAVILKRSDFHFSESQRVPVAIPPIPHHTVIVPHCVVADVVVVAVQVGVKTAAEPPATFVVHCTRAAAEDALVVVLVSSAELLSKMPSQ